ncbi:hypothetical protein F5Y10DRAFT_237731, partial [Nemania abortiva]
MILALGTICERPRVRIPEEPTSDFWRCYSDDPEHLQHACSISGLVVKSIVAIDGPRVRFTADASHFLYFIELDSSITTHNSGRQPT